MREGDSDREHCKDDLTMSDAWVAKWTHRETPVLPKGFRYSIYELGDVIAWVKKEDAAVFMCQARRGRAEVILRKAYEESAQVDPEWTSREVTTLPRGFRYVIMAGSEVVAWVKKMEHAKFIAGISADLKETKERLRRPTDQT